jgi:hypothetical protein
MEVYSALKGLSAEEIYQDYSNHLTPVFQRLDYLIGLDIGDTRAEELLSNPGFNSAFDVITRFRSMYTAKLEVEQAKAMIRSRDAWAALEDFAYLPNYLQLARTEYRGAGLKPEDCVLFLGSGPLPISLIVLCHQYGLRGIGIEQEPDRAELSRTVLDKLGLSVIFDHLATVLPAGTKVSYRSYEKGLRKLLDTFYRYELPAQFDEYLRVRPKPPANNTVVFLTTTNGECNSTLGGRLRDNGGMYNTE